MKRFVLTSATLLAAFSAGLAPAHAAPTQSADRVVVAMSVGVDATPRTTLHYEARREISAAEAKRIALSRVRGGEVVDIRRVRGAYRVRVIARDGRVVDIVVDAATGRVR